MGQGKKRIYTQKKLTPKKSKAERKKARSPNGFLALMTGFVGMCAWTLWGAVKKERADLERSKVCNIHVFDWRSMCVLVGQLLVFRVSTERNGTKTKYIAWNICICHMFCCTYVFLQVCQ